MYAFFCLTLKEDEEMNTHSIENDSKIENVRVVVRVRPMDKIEFESGCENIVRVDKLNRCITVIKPNTSAAEPPKVYYFDNVFAEDSSQVSIQIELTFQMMAENAVYSIKQTIDGEFILYDSSILKLCVCEK